jgi:FtsH-binding integral membrane protein
MTTMTRSVEPLARNRRRAVTTAAFVALFWAIAAVLVATAHLQFDRISPLGSAAVEIAVLVGVAFGYMRFAARDGTVDHALLVGIVWLLLTIVAELLIQSRVHHGWFALLGTPARPVLRNVFLFVWIFAPAMFARRESID